MLSSPPLVTPTAVAELDLCSAAGLPHAGTGGQAHASAPAAVTRPDGVGQRPPAAGVWAWWGMGPVAREAQGSPGSPPRPSYHLRALGLATLGLVAVTLAVYAAVGMETHWCRWFVPTGNLPRGLMISLIIFCAALLSSTVGFAFSALAGALILHYVTDGVDAVQIMMIASIGIQAYSVACLWRSIQWERCRPFMAGGVAAFPCGIALLLHLQSRTYMVGMGVGLVCYGLYMLVRRPARLRSGPRPMADALAGALGGITGPLAAFPGAGVTIWCGMRGWDKVEQRAVYQPYILIMQLIGVSTLSLLQPHSSFEPALLAYALPGVAGAVLGLRVFHALTATQFQRMLHLALIVSGSTLLLK